MEVPVAKGDNDNDEEVLSLPATLEFPLWGTWQKRHESRIPTVKPGTKTRDCTRRLRMGEKVFRKLELALANCGGSGLAMYPGDWDYLGLQEKISYKRTKVLGLSARYWSLHFICQFS